MGDGPYRKPALMPKPSRDDRYDEEPDALDVLGCLLAIAFVAMCVWLATI